jgi:signal transduction histidine kinase
VKLTIRTRLSLMFAFSAVLILLALSVFIYSFTLRFRKNEFQYRLKARLIEADSLLRKNSAYPFITLEHLPPGTLPEEHFYYRRPAPLITVPEPNGLVQLAPLQAIEKERYYFMDKGERSYLLHFDKKLGNVIVLSAVDVFGYTKMRNLKTALIVGVVLGTLAMGFISWYWPKRELQPIADKIKKARRINAQSLNLRLNVRNEYDELGELAITFNQMLDRIETAFEAQRRFTSNAAHELRNPITAISGEAQLALTQPRTAEEYEATLKRIKEKSSDLAKLVERLLILSKIESSTHTHVPVRLDEVLFNALKSVQNRYPQQAQNIRLHMDEAERGDYTLQGDEMMLQVAIDNVVENALKYGEGKPVRIHLGCRSGFCSLSVVDEGLGVTPDELGKLFQVFYRNPNVRHIQGTGIGLPLVKSIVEWHGGTIDIMPHQPAGTKVQISFPKS